MSSFLLRTLFLFLPYCTFAQLEDGSIAPDFTLQDLQGNTWHLYELLDSGKHVLLDFSATWCSPCWDYHESGELNQAYTIYGPGGTNELIIIMIEGDDDTNLDCLFNLPGCNYSTQGDWTAGTLYPIINDDLVADTYEIRGWPTHFYICPDKRLSRTDRPGLETIEYFLGSCAEPTGIHDATISKPTSAFAELLVYPNPVVDELHLQLQSTHTISIRVSVIHSMGESILTLPEMIFSPGVNKHSIDLSHLSPGMYVVQIESGRGVLMRRIVVAQ